MNHRASFGGYEALWTGSEKKVSCVRAPPGNRTWCNCTVSAKRVRTSISRLLGCQLKKAARRNSVYRLTVSASVAGTLGMPSTPRLSPGRLAAYSAWTEVRKKRRRKPMQGRRLTAGEETTGIQICNTTRMLHRTHAARL